MLRGANLQPSLPVAWINSFTCGCWCSVINQSVTMTNKRPKNRFGVRQADRRASEVDFDFHSLLARSRNFVCARRETEEKRKLVCNSKCLSTVRHSLGTSTHIQENSGKYTRAGNQIFIFLFFLIIVDMYLQSENAHSWNSLISSK